MLNLAVNTKLDAEEVLNRGLTYFIQENGLTLVELIAHLHAEEGACEIRFSGGRIRGNKDQDSLEVLKSQIDHLEREFGFHLVYYGLHIHALPTDDPGHLMVTIQTGKPAEITLESQELDFQAKDFAERLPHARILSPTG